MARNYLVAALSIIAAAAPASASPNMPGPSPTDRADTLYCLRIAPATGSLAETVRCWTRAQWVEQGVDVDKEWAKEGVAIRG